MIVLESNQNHATISETEICPTLSASMGMGGGYIPMIIQSYGFKPMQGETAQGLGYEAEKSPTLTVTPSCGGGC